MKKIFCVQIILILLMLALVGCNKKPNGEDDKACKHDFTASVISPSCTDEGYTLRECKLCGKAYKTDTTPKLAHDYIEYYEDSYCNKNKLLVTECTQCGDRQTVETDIQGAKHNYIKIQTVIPTKTELETMGNGIFASCDAITEITVPSTVKSLNQITVYCDSLKKITLKTTATPGESLAYECKNLEYVIFADGTEYNRGACSIHQAS